MKTISKRFMGCFLIAMFGLFMAPWAVYAQDHGSGGHGGGGGGCGDVFGDLVHILRDPTTGQPILAQRWIELPAEIPGYGWGYCPIAVYHDENGDQQEIPFLPLTCDMDPDYLDLVEEVDYFGRLNGGRTKERNHRMHLNEVISNIKQADVVRLEETGRIELGFDCNGPGQTPCAEWATIDSPMESMALYVRAMKYGHIATDPYEVDTWAHGDPKLGAQFHPALDEEDWPKFQNSVKNLLPGEPKNPADAAMDCFDYEDRESFVDESHVSPDGEIIPANGVWDPAEPFIDIDKDGEFDAVGPPKEPFTDLNGNGVWDDAEEFYDENSNGVADAFTFLCADPEELSNADFVSGATYIAAAANKTGKVTDDLIQYVNRFLKITQKTQVSEATLNTLPALYRDCWSLTTPPFPEDAEDLFDDPIYDDQCTIVPADSILTPNYPLFPDVQEKFVDFSGLDEYERDFENVSVILNSTETTWLLSERVSLTSWVELLHGEEHEVANIAGFRAAANDVLRSIEYVHNYDPPVNLYCSYDTSECGEVLE